MKKTISILLGLSLLSFIIFQALAKGTEDEAKALLEKASQHVKDVGQTQALADFNTAEYINGDLYIYCIAPDGKTTAHAANNSFLGVNFLFLRDVDGKAFGKEMLEMSKTKPEGYVDYKWLNPVTKKIDEKRAFYKMINDQLCAVGVYKN